MDKLPQISEAEYEIMKIIWDESPISTNSICEKVPSIHNWSNKTVHTLLSRLVRSLYYQIHYVLERSIIAEKRDWKNFAIQKRLYLS